MADEKLPQWARGVQSEEVLGEIRPPRFTCNHIGNQGECDMWNAHVQAPYRLHDVDADTLCPECKHPNTLNEV
ncbi:MAG: hypothetical protein H0U10_17540 [Chloroflexia bacterium]|nr:hypothetical protein [Chloroflexia bacterium]